MLQKIRLILLLLLCSTTLLAAPVNFKLPDLDGNLVQVSDYRGKWVLVNFWASWCGPCIKELPELAKFQATNASNVQVIGLNFEETNPQETKAFLKTLAPTGFPHVKDDGKGLGMDFFVDKDGNTISLQGLPSTFFINPQGELFDVHIGPLTAADLDKKMRQWATKKRQ